MHECITEGGIIALYERPLCSPYKMLTYIKAREMKLSKVIQ